VNSLMGLLARGGAPDCVASGFSCGAVRMELEEVLQLLRR
jgi:hypothetical protein